MKDKKTTETRYEELISTFTIHSVSFPKEYSLHYNLKFSIYLSLLSLLGLYMYFHRRILGYFIIIGSHVSEEILGFGKCCCHLCARDWHGQVFLKGFHGNLVILGILGSKPPITLAQASLVLRWLTSLVPWVLRFFPNLRINLSRCVVILMKLILANKTTRFRRNHYIQATKGNKNIP